LPILEHRSLGSHRLTFATIHHPFQVGYTPARADILQGIDGVDFDEAWPRRVELSLEGVPVHVVSAEDLIKNKLTSGRLSDLADVEAIREANPERDGD
jgi:hypothetical protein